MKRQSRFEEGDTAGWKKWLKEQPQKVQDDWAANTEKYGDLFKQAGSKLASGTVSMLKQEAEKYRRKHESLTYDIYQVYWDNPRGSRATECIVHLFSDGTIEILEEHPQTGRLRTVIPKTSKVFADTIGVVIENYFFDKENVSHNLIRANVDY